MSRFESKEGSYSGARKSQDVAVQRSSGRRILSYSGRGQPFVLISFSTEDILYRAICFSALWGSSDLNANLIQKCLKETSKIMFV